MSRTEQLKRIPAPRDGTSWTAPEDAIVLRSDITIIEMCFMLGRSYNAVSNRRATLRASTKPELQNTVRTNELTNGEWFIDPVKCTDLENRMLRSVTDLVSSGMPERDASKLVTRNILGYDNPQTSHRLFLKWLNRGQDPYNHHGGRVASGRGASGPICRTMDLIGHDGCDIHLAVPYDRVNETHRECFTYGAFSKSIRERAKKIKLFLTESIDIDDKRMHIVGRPLELSEQRNRLNTIFRTTDTYDVNLALASRVQIRFRHMRHYLDQDDIMVYTECALMDCRFAYTP